MMDITSQYRTRDGKVLIDLALDRLDRLFNTLDPAPFREKDIDADAEEYIVGAVREFPHKTPLILVINLPESEVRVHDPEVIRDGIHNYFAYRSEVVRRELRMTFRQGRASLLIGLVFLFICLTLHSLFSAMGDRVLISQIISEGLLIMGWVAMWRPLELLLYDWWPVRQRVLTYRKISEMQIEIRCR
jgi:hypothetical protein